MVLSPLTGAPVAVVPALTITDNLLHLTPTEAEGNVEGYERPTRNAGGSGPDVRRPDDTTDWTRSIPVDTPIVVQQDNPKRGQSFDRYEEYKGATTVGEYLAQTSRGWSDFTNDFERGYITVFMIMALESRSACLNLDWSPVPASLPEPDTPILLAVSFAARAHPHHVRVILDDMDTESE